MLKIMRKMVLLMVGLMRWMSVDKEEMHWTVDCLDDIWSGISADRDQKITIKKIGGCLIKRYNIVVSGKDASNGCLPSGISRAFTITYVVESMYGIRHLQNLITGCRGIGMRKYGDKCFLKIEDENESRYTINATIVVEVKSRYNVGIGLDIAKSKFNAPTMVRLKESAICKCVA